MTRDERMSLTKCFVRYCSEVTPVREIDDRRIGTGRPENFIINFKGYFDNVKGDTTTHPEWRHNYYL